MEELVEKKCRMSELLKGYRALPQISLSVPVTDKSAAMAGVDALAKRLERELGLRIVVRPSGTENVIRVMAEGESEENCALACKILSSKISAD